MTANLFGVTLDCADAAKVATFWSEVLGRPLDDGATAEFATIGLQDPPENWPHWMFVQVPEGKAAKNRVHPDLYVDDLDAELKRIIDLGAVQKAEYNEGGFHWHTLADPEGNEFDIGVPSA
jgi:predicted enzyme related to lactoylglutathione lyase